jgi:heme/copper-type cytochrome/quinol oxidase subunit 2
VKFDAFIFQIALLFLPGVIWARLDVAWARPNKPSDLEFFVLSFLYGIASYVITYCIYMLFVGDFEFVNVDRPSLLTGAVIQEVIVATIVGFVLGLAWIYASTYKFMARTLQHIKATKRYGDEDVWDFTFNSRSKSVEYIHWRDFEQKLVYAGDVNTFSEAGDTREIVLRDVTVYDFDGNKLYDVPLMYLARKSDSIHIEFPNPNTDARNGEGS